MRLFPRLISEVTSLIFAHVNPYGTFELDMDYRIDLNAGKTAS